MKIFLPIFSLIMLIACGALGFAYYLQHVNGLLPCPLCILQRYGFTAIILLTFLNILREVCIFSKTSQGRLGWIRFVGAILGMLFALASASIALWHLWVMNHPTISCGRDPLEAFLNRLWSAWWFPSLFQADAYASCSDLTGLWGLSLPLWSLFVFIGVFGLFAYLAFQSCRCEK